jgi:hypothetical protein
MSDRARAAAAGGAAALAWAALEPLDQRLFRRDYSDVALLGKWATRSRWWPVVGLALHTANGAAFGLAFEEVRRRTNAHPRRLAFTLAMVENFGLYPLACVVDARHPARGTRGLAPLVGGRALAQATARHALFGYLLGRWSRR